MKGRDKLLFNLLTVLLLVIIVLVILKTRDSDKQIKKWQADIIQRQERGVQDPQLRETVDKLESELRARLAETFELEEDPLDLIRVIKTKKFRKSLGMTETAETEGRLRLSCTISSPLSASAIVKYKGRSHVLSAGDKIDDYTVRRIGKNSIRLVRGVEVLDLVTEKAPDTIAEEEKMFGENLEKMPVIEVKQVQTGNY